LAPDKPGITHWANQISLDAGFDLKFPIDMEFEILYPTEHRTTLEESEIRHKPVVENLASKWATKKPLEIARKIARIEEEAKLSGTRWPRWTPHLCSMLSGLVDSPIMWARSFFDEGCDADLILPFMRKSVEIDEKGWLDTTVECLHLPHLMGVAISIVLTMENAPEDLLDEALKKLTGFGSLITSLFYGDEIPERTMIRLLRHEDWEIASAAAKGEWYSTPKGEIRETLKSEWRNAVARSRDDYFVSLVIVADAELAFSWLENFLQDGETVSYKCGRALSAAMSALDLKSKKRVLEIIPPESSYEELVYGLIGNELELYRVLLGNKLLELFHLIPLKWHDQDIWKQKAKLAMDAGYSPSYVADAAYGFHGLPWMGSESKMWKEWVDRFDSLLLHEDKRIRQVGAIGKADAEAKLQGSLKSEHDEKVFGIGATRRQSRYNPLN